MLFVIQKFSFLSPMVRVICSSSSVQPPNWCGDSFWFSYFVIYAKGWALHLMKFIMKSISWIGICTRRKWHNCCHSSWWICRRKLWWNAMPVFHVDGKHSNRYNVLVLFGASLRQFWRMDFYLYFFLILRFLTVDSHTLLYFVGFTKRTTYPNINILKHQIANLT